jgi:hypothetical protein
MTHIDSSLIARRAARILIRGSVGMTDATAKASNVVNAAFTYAGILAATAEVFGVEPIAISSRVTDAYTMNNEPDSRHSPMWTEWEARIVRALALSLARL